MTATIDTPKRAGRPPKAGADVARTRATRWNDADWEAVKRIGMDRLRELVRAEDARQARQAAKAAAGAAIYGSVAPG